MEQRTTIITKCKEGKFAGKYRVQIWVDELMAWLAFDGFADKKTARKFLYDEKEMIERDLFIERTIKEQRRIANKARKLKQKNESKKV